MPYLYFTLTACIGILSLFQFILIDLCTSFLCTVVQEKWVFIPLIVKIQIHYSKYLFSLPYCQHIVKTSPIDVQLWLLWNLSGSTGQWKQFLSFLMMLDIRPKRYGRSTPQYPRLPWPLGSKSFEVKTADQWLHIIFFQQGGVSSNFCLQKYWACWLASWSSRRAKSMNWRKRKFYLQYYLESISYGKWLKS